MELTTYYLPSEMFRKIEPILKSCYGIDRNDINRELYNSMPVCDYTKLPNADKYIGEDKRFKIVEYAVDNCETIPITISDTDLKSINTFTSKYDYPKGSILDLVLTFVYLYFKKVEEKLTDEEEDYLYYVHNIRPEMLKLYIALEKSKPSDSTNIKFGKVKSVKVDNPYSIPWFRMLIRDYLDKYLGVGSLKEAELELLNVYGKKVGPKQNPVLARLYWGTYHLLQMSDEYKSKEGSVTREQCRFIANYAILLGGLDPVEEDDISGNVKSLVNYYLKNFNTIDELIPAAQYKLPPNYKSLKRYY